MAVVKIDERGRITLPKGIGYVKGRAIVINAGSFLVVVPVSKEPLKIAGKWLPTDTDSKTLRNLAEKEATEDAVKRAKRRKQQ